MYKYKYKFGCNESSRSLLQDHCSVRPSSRLSSVSHKIITKPYIYTEGKKTNKGNFLQRLHRIIISFHGHHFNIYFFTSAWVGWFLIYE